MGNMAVEVSAGFSVTPSDRTSSDSGEVAWYSLQRAHSHLVSVARVDPTRRHPNLVERYRQLVWIPFGESWFSAKRLPLLDESVCEESAKCEESSESVRVSFPTLTAAAYIGEDERFRIAVEEGARAEYDLAAFEKPVAFFATLAFYASGIVAIFCVLVIQMLKVLGEANLTWILVPFDLGIAVALELGRRTAIKTPDRYR